MESVSRLARFDALDVYRVNKGRVPLQRVVSVFQPRGGRGLALMRTMNRLPSVRLSTEFAVGPLQAWSSAAIPRTRRRIRRGSSSLACGLRVSLAICALWRGEG